MILLTSITIYYLTCSSVLVGSEVRNEALFISVGYRSGFLGHWAHEDLAKEVVMMVMC